MIYYLYNIIYCIVLYFVILYYIIYYINIYYLYKLGYSYVWNYMWGFRQQTTSVTVTVGLFEDRWRFQYGTHTHIYTYTNCIIYLYLIYTVYIYKQCTELHTYHLSGHKNSGSKSVRITHWTGVRVNQQKYLPPVIHNIASIHDT